MKAITYSKKLTSYSVPVRVIPVSFAKVAFISFVFTVAVMFLLYLDLNQESLIPLLTLFTSLCGRLTHAWPRFHLSGGHFLFFNRPNSLPAALCQKAIFIITGKNFE